MNKFSILLVTSFGLIVSCQTTRISDVDPPSHVVSYFSACNQQRDGGLVASFRDDSVTLATVDMDWVTTQTGDWIAELSGYLGQPLIRVNYRKQENVVSASGSLARQLPKLSGRKDGYLVADGHFLAVQAHEVACLFRGVLPRDWLRDVVSVRRSKGAITYNISQKKRRIEFHARRPGSGYCATIRWRTHLKLVGHRIDYCHDPKGEYTHEIKGFRNIAMQWRQYP